MDYVNHEAPSMTNLSARMRGYVERGEIPGVVYAIERGGEPTIEAIGWREIDRREMTRDTIFRIASMTKPIIATASMILVEEGSIGLDDPVDDFLPELSDRRVLRSIDAELDDTVPANRSITLRDLLTFTWGFGIVMAQPGSYPIQRAMDELALGQGPPNPDSFPDPDEWMRRLGSLPLMHQPGEGWMYNTGSDVLGVLISRVAGMPLEDLLQERIFQPLGMVDTAFSVPESKIERLATSYGAEPDTGAFEVYDSARNGQWSRPPAFPSGASGLVSTVDDYLAFARMLLDRGTYRGRRILDKSSISLMTTNHLTPMLQRQGEPILESNMSWGFGVGVTTEQSDIPCSVGTYGWNGGLGTTWSNDPVTGSCLILLTQANWSSPKFPTIAREFLKTGYSDISAANRNDPA